MNRNEMQGLDRVLRLTAPELAAIERVSPSTEDVDLYAEIEAARDEAALHGWDEEFRERVLAGARRRATDAARSEARRLDRATAFEARLPTLQRLHLSSCYPDPRERRGRLDRALGGLSIALERSLPRDLRRAGSAVLWIRGSVDDPTATFESTSAAGDAHDAGADRVHPACKPVRLMPFVERQFSTFGEFSADLSQALTRTVIDLLRSGGLELPSFRARGEGSLEWRPVEHGSSSMGETSAVPALGAGVLARLKAALEAASVADDAAAQEEVTIEGWPVRKWNSAAEGQPSSTSHATTEVVEPIERPVGPRLIAHLAEIEGLTTDEVRERLSQLIDVRRRLLERRVEVARGVLAELDAEQKALGGT